MKNILFDLDGTLTDPFVGICSSVRYSLNKVGIEVESLEVLKPFIGPPLLNSFMEFYGMNEEEANRAIGRFREYFSKIGIFENELYEGIDVCLKELKEHGYRLYICTSKPEVFAKEIVRHFHIDQYFDGVYGSTLENTRTLKAEVIQYCLDEAGIHKDDCIMVGDRKHDVIGAHTVGMKCIGVLYGHGSLEEFKECHCDYIVEDVYELKDKIMTNNLS